VLAFDPKMKWQPDANKIVVLIGDAPPRAAEQKDILDLVREARESPGALSGKAAAREAAAEPPFLTSCIGVFVELHGKLREQEGYREFVDSQRTMRNAFKEIAAAGGGIFAEVEFAFTDEPSPEDEAKSKDRRERDARRAGVAIASAATKRIVEHILVLSFGERFAREMHEFVRIFYEYREAGVIG
jgi:hypothetical protein